MLLLLLLLLLLLFMLLLLLGSCCFQLLLVQGLLLLLLFGSRFIADEFLFGYLVQAFVPVALKVLPHALDEFIFRLIGFWLANGLSESRDAECLLNG